MRLLVLILLLVPSLAFGSVPRAALRYERALLRETQYTWGLGGPAAAEGAQVQQESGWNPAAHSSVASGLAEFTPDTAEWISGAYKLGNADPYNPEWAIRALVTYDHDLWGKTAGATACDHMAFVLSAYNGGIGWVYRDQALTKTQGKDPARWWGNVEAYTKRSAAATKENRSYPRRILLTLQPDYTAWGGYITCQVPA